MRTSATIIFSLILAFVALKSPAEAKNLQRIGAGVHYWASLEDIIIEDSDDDGLAVMLSYQYQFVKLFTIEANLEFMGKGYAGSSQTVIAPQFYGLIGRGIYGGVGLGMSYTDGAWANSPFWALRAGFDLELFPSFFLDLNLNYRTETWELNELEDDVRLQTITAGAILRYEF